MMSKTMTGLIWYPRPRRNPAARQKPAARDETRPGSRDFSSRSAPANRKGCRTISALVARPPFVTVMTR